MELQQDQIDQYNRDGAVLLKGILTQEELALLEAGLEESYTDPGKRFSRVRSPDGKGETFLESFPSLKSRSLKQLLDLGHIPEIAGRVMEASSAQLILGQVFYKDAGFVNATPWHQDTPYLRVRGNDMVRIWLTCDPSPKEITLKMVRGSHRWNVVYNTRPPDTKIVQTGEGKMFAPADGQDDLAAPMPDIARYSDSFDILTWDVEPGDALVFNGNMIHAAGELENSPHKRRAYATMWGGPDLRYIAPHGHAIPTFAEINGYEIPGGSRIGDYPDAFPVGWKEMPVTEAAEA